MFDLLRYFSISSAIVIAVLGGGVGNFVRWYETSRLVAVAEQQNQATAAQMVDIAWDPHAEFLRSTTERNPARLRQSTEIGDIDRSVRQVAARLPVYKVTIFTPDGITLYSSDLSEIGAPLDRSNEDLLNGLGGRHSSRLVEVSSVLGMSGWLRDIDSVQTYLPKFDPNGQVIGVVRVDTDVTATSEHVNATIRSTVLLCIGVCILLYASLYAIVARADRLMKSQYEALQGFNDRLEAEVSQRTALVLGQQRKLGELMRSVRFQSGTLDEAFAALNESGTEILDVDRCGIYVPVAGAEHFDVIDVYERRTNCHTGRFTRPATFFMSGAQLLHEGDVVCLSDVLTATDVQENFRAYYRDLDIRSAIDVPIFIDGRQAGILCLRKSGEAHEWRADERLAAGALATLAALVLQRTEREKAEATIVASTQRLARQQAALADMARDVALPSNELETVLRPMLRTFTEVSGGATGGIWILSEDRLSFSYAETFSTGSGRIVPTDTDRAFNLGALELHRDAVGAVSVPDVRTHTRLSPLHSDLQASAHTIALLRAPIAIDGSLVGFVSCEASQPTDWTTEQSLFVTGFANIAALAIERHQRRRAEGHIRADAETLSRQQNVLNDLLHSESFRNGSLSAAMRKLSRTLALEADLDRVAIMVRESDCSRIEYAETYLVSQDTFLRTSDGEANMATAHAATQRNPDGHSVLQLPLEVGGEVAGQISASTCGRSITWSTKQKLFATAIGNLAALTIERSRRQGFERAIAAAAARFEMQQAAITEFMSDESWRREGRTEAVRKLSRMASETLGIERISIWTMSPDCSSMTALDLYDQRTGIHSDGVVLSEADHPRYFAAILVDGVVSSEDSATDVRLASLQEGYFSTLGVRSMLGMPILMDGAPVGVVCAEKCGERISWSEEHRLFLSAVTSLVALVVERMDRKRAEDEIVAGAKRLAHMLETFSSLMQSEVVRHGSLQETLRELSRTLCEEIDVDRTAVLLVESRSNDVVSAEAYVRGPDGHGRHEAPLYPPGRSWPEIRTHIDIASDLAVEDAAAHRSFTANEADLVRSQNLGSLLQMPIIIDGNVTGTVRATTIGRKVKWSAEARLFAAAIAQLASLAVERNTRQRVERDLRHANLAAEQANRAKSQFLANMSHEIRTPMNGVFGMTEILIKSPLSDRQRRQVGTIHDSAKTLLTIVNDILDLARIEDGKMPIDAQMFDLHHCIESAAELFAEDAQRKGLQLHVFIAPETPTHIVGDTGRLRQVCVNLISNAIKFTKRGGIDIRLAGSTSPEGEASITIDVIDTGIGIDQATAARLFEPFTQADSSISRRFGGTGLGLSISRHLISLMGGTLTLDSRPELGTRVSIKLKCPVAAVPQSPAADVEVLRGQRILVIDDRDTNREIIVDYLAGTGALPVNARTGEMALEILDAAADGGHPFAAVIVDMLMPDMDGMAVCRAIRDNPLLPPTGLVMATSLTWDGDLRAANDLGITRLLTKPVRRADLLEAVARAVVAPRPVTAPALENPQVRTWNLQARVLLAEDNPVNEEVARELLLGLGCTIVVATDGRAACTAFQAEPFDIVLMDCQMPEMDGLTATRRLRQLEQNLGRPRTPVIAVTAHAFDADRVACRDAGMDDYLMKPFSEAELADILMRWIAPANTALGGLILPPAAQSGSSVAADSATTAGDMAGSLDQAFLSDLRERRPQLFERLLNAYLSHSPKNVDQLLEALSRGQVDALYLAAHSLKSSSANVGAKRIADLARQIEAKARGGNLSDITPMAEMLRQEFKHAQALMTSALAAAKSG